MGGSHLTDEPSQKGKQMTKSDLIRYLKQNAACPPAITWLEEQKAFGPELIRLCPQIDWLRWLLGVISPEQCYAKVEPIRKEYEARVKPIWKEYDARVRPIRKQCYAKVEPIWKEYEARVGPIREEYDIQAKTIWASVS